MESTSTWLITIGILSAVIAFDLIIAILRRNKETSTAEAAIWTVIYVSAAIAFGYFMPNWTPGENAQKEFFAGWLTEYALSVDNIFVFVIILSRLQIDKTKQQLVLLLGIIIALVLRGIFIAAGSAIITRFSSAFFLFGAFLIYTAYTLVKETEHEEWKEGKVITFMRSKGASTFTLALVAIAMTDVLFAFDSIPAIFGLTQEPYIIVTANIFALMGLRQLYFIIGGLMKKLIYLSEGLAIILGFIGLKLIFEASHFQGWHKFFGVPIPEISLALSLSVILGVLVMTTALSLIKGRKQSA